MNRKTRHDPDQDRRATLFSQTTRLQAELENYEEAFVYRASLSTLLADLEHNLSARAEDRKGLEDPTFGIFRLVMDSSTLETSRLGKELLGQHHEIRRFISK